jgi:hypothetical protein
MDMIELEGTNMVKEHNHLMNHRLGGGYEYGGGALPPDEPSARRRGYGYGGYPYGGGECMNMVEEHYHPMNHRLEVESIDREDSDMKEDMMVEVDVVERAHEDVVLERH